MSYLNKRGESDGRERLAEERVGGEGEGGHGTLKRSHSHSYHCYCCM